MTKPMRNFAQNQIHYDYEAAEPMSHDEALEINAVELYVLKGLMPDQEERFEEHYFECQECACGVAVEQALIKPAGFAMEREPWWRRWAFPILAPACALLSGTVGFQSLELAQLNSPMANTVILAKDTLKGPQEGVSIKTQSVTIELNLPIDKSPFYLVKLESKGKQAFAQVVPAPAGPRLSLRVPGKLLSSGTYSVDVLGLANADDKSGAALGQYRFSIADVI